MLATVAISSAHQVDLTIYGFTIDTTAIEVEELVADDISSSNARNDRLMTLATDGDVQQSAVGCTDGIGDCKLNGGKALVGSG